MDVCLAFSLVAALPDGLFEHPVSSISVLFNSCDRLSMPALIVRDSKDGAVLTVHVQPKAAFTACVGIYGEALKIRIAAPPAGGAANRELIRFLADELSLPTAAVHIESGESSRHKRVRLKGTTAVAIMTRLMPKGAMDR
jgi:hypothetical protein